MSTVLTLLLWRDNVSESFRELFRSRSKLCDNSCSLLISSSFLFFSSSTCFLNCLASFHSIKRARKYAFLSLTAFSYPFVWKLAPFSICLVLFHASLARSSAFTVWSCVVCKSVDFKSRSPVILLSRLLSCWFSFNSWSYLKVISCRSTKALIKWLLRMSISRSESRSARHEVHSV